LSGEVGEVSDTFSVKADVQKKGEKKIQRLSRTGGGMKVIMEILANSDRPLNAS